MASNEEILIHFQGIDNVSPTVQKIDQTISGTMGAATRQSGGFMNSMRELGGIFRGLNGLIMGVFGTYGLSTFKSMTYDTATAREQILQLYETVAGTTKVAGPALDLWNRMDELTNHGYVSLDQLASALNVLGMSAGASVPQMDSMVGLINEIGNRAILMGYDANRTQLLMNNVATGLNGNLDMLNNAFGITKGKLEDLGWDGTTKDIEGYNKALKEYLGIDEDAGEHLDNTQGKVISLQKRFRIAGRNLGNYMLPPLNAIMDAFTSMNEKSNDLLASLIIIGTGAMSGFASILPTLSPLIELYDFIGRNQINLNIGGITDLMRTRTVTGRILGNVNDLIASPIAGWIRYWTRSNFLPYIDRVRVGIRKLYLTHVLYSDTFTRLNSLSNNFTTRFLNGLGRISRGVGNAQLKLSEFVATYGSLEGRANVIGRLFANSDRLEQFGNPTRVNIMNQGNIASKATNFLQKRNYGGIAQNKEEFIAKQIQEYDDALKNNRRQQELNRLERQKGILATIQNALGLGTDTARTVANTAAKEFNVGMTLAERTAKADANKQQAITNLLKLEERGIIETSALYMALYNLGILNEAETRALVGEATFAEMNAKTGLLGINFSLASINFVLLAQILLIVGAVLLVIAVIDQIGKTLGWWSNWKEMLAAINSGLNRLWQAFINNPNVQAFIKDLQWLFGELGGAIQWVAWQILGLFGWKDDGSEFDFVRLLINVFGGLADILGKVVNAIKWVESTFHIFGTIYTVVSTTVGGIVWILQTIICILLGCSPGIVPALQKVEEIFRSVFGSILGFITNPVGFIVNQFRQLVDGIGEVGDILGGFILNQINKFLDFLGPLGTTIRNIFGNALPVVANMVQGIANTIGQVWGIFSGMFTGKIGVEEGLNRLTMIIRPVLERLWLIFVSIFTRIKDFVIRTAKNLVSGFVNYLLSIPSRILGFFSNLLSRLLMLPQQIYNTGKEFGQSLYNGVDSAVSGLTGGLIHLPGANQQQNAKTNAKTMGNATKNYNRTRQINRGHTINIGKGAIQLDARNLTTKESKQIMINALEGLTTYETVHTKKATAQK